MMAFLRARYCPRPWFALGVCLAILPALASAQPIPEPAAPAQPDSEIDLFMKRVLDNREAIRRRLDEFLLRETETLDVGGPAGFPLAGYRYEYEWYVRDNDIVRSPIRMDGVEIGDAERRAYEEDWRRREQSRRSRGDERRPDEEGNAAGEVGNDQLELTFFSETDFLDFTFEPGNYYLVGRETLAGRDVVKIEYYPTTVLFGGDDRDTDEPDPGDPEVDEPDADRSGGEERRSVTVSVPLREFNKTTLVTLWVDPEAHQIVKYTLDNTGLDFLPGRWLVRVDGLSASMEMGQPLDDVWLPLRVTVSARATMALGEFNIRATREFSDYREAETGGRLIDAGDPGGDPR